MSRFSSGEIVKADQQSGEQMILPKADRVPTSTSARTENDDVRGSSRSALSRRWLLLPRERGAWGMVILPFLAAAAIAPGTAFSIRTAAALLAVFSIFLLRDPLVVLRRIHSDGSRPEAANQRLTAKRSLSFCLGGLALSGTILLMTLPPSWVLLLGTSGLALVFGSVMIAMERVQREITFQMLSVAGLTGSCLPAYFLASVLVVRARLETILSRRRASVGFAPGRFFRTAVGWHASLWAALAAAVLLGYAWWSVPFLFPGALHAWELRKFRQGNGLQVSMHWVGWSQLAASALFYFLLVLLFRLQLLS